MKWWPFGKKKTIGEAGIMSGLTDWHSHLLPGVDDGIPHPDQTFETLNQYSRLGVSRVWLTPHVMEDIPNTPHDLRRKFAQLFNLPAPETSDLTRAVWKADNGTEIEVFLGSENMLDNLFDMRLQERQLLPIGRDGDNLLVETSYLTPPSDMLDKLRRTLAAGYYPVLAHPERYVYMHSSQYRRLLDMGIKFQLNIYSLTGMYGTAAAKKARELLSSGAYTLMGTDTHRHSQLDKALSQQVLSSSDISALLKLKDNNYV